MLRTNLATRPFYNERAVYIVLGMVAVVGLVVLSFEVDRIVALSRGNTELTTAAERAEGDAAEVLTQIAEIQRSVSPQMLEEVAAAAREANLLIDQRVFSWTDFFNRIETTLPSDVMLTEVRPNIAPGSIQVTMGVLGRRLNFIDDFVEALEGSGAFTGVLNTANAITDDGMYTAVVEGRYLQTLPRGPAGDGDDEPLSDTEPDDEDAAAGDVGPEVEPEPTPADRGGDLL